MPVSHHTNSSLKCLIDMMCSIAESVDDDATIDNDFSSLTSFEEAPPTRNGRHSYSSAFDSDDEDEESLRPPKNGENPMPSWASRTDTNASPDPKTVLSRKSVLASVHSEREERESNPVAPTEERPIRAPKKTFEELLAEQLGTSMDEVNEDAAFVKRQTPVHQRVSGAKSFLRKGSGLARYGGVGSPPKAFHRSKSTNNVNGSIGTPASIRSNRLKSSTSCSKLDIADRETIAFASKKSPPKRASAVKNGKATAQLALKTSANGKGSPKKFANQESPKKIKDKDEDVSPIYDSVEWSFREKLKKADLRHKVQYLHDHLIVHSFGKEKTEMNLTCIFSFYSASRNEFIFQFFSAKLLDDFATFTFFQFLKVKYLEKLVDTSDNLKPFFAERTRRAGGV